MRSSYNKTGSETKIGVLGEIYKNDDFWKVVGMAFSIVENVGAPRESMFNVSRGSQLPYRQKPGEKKGTNKITLALKNMFHSN